MTKEKTTIIILSAILLVATTAVASVYLTRPAPQAERVATGKQHHVRAQQRTASNCNDGNIAGKAVGGVGGGVLGSLVGKGNGKTAATIGGTLGGAYVGGETIPLNNVTCR